MRKQHKTQSYFQLLCFSISVALLTACATGNDTTTPSTPSGTSAGKGRDDIPMLHVIQTNDWEQLDSMWGVNMPARHIWVQESGFRLRKKLAGIGGSGDATPVCVNYGGFGATIVQTIEVQGHAGQQVHFLQGTGDC